MAAMMREARSRIMSAIRKRDTKPELVVRRFLHAKGLRYTLHGSAAFGLVPDERFDRSRELLRREWRLTFLRGMLRDVGAMYGDEGAQRLARICLGLEPAQLRD
jgi:hypothetical protein